MNAYGTLAYADVPQARMAAATSFFLSIQNITVGLGVAFSALSVRAAQAWWPQAEVPVHFSLALAALALCCLLSLGVSFLFDRDAGHELVGARAPR
jgi:hypothetical protein